MLRVKGCHADQARASIEVHPDERCDFRLFNHGTYTEEQVSLAYPIRTVGIAIRISQMMVDWGTLGASQNPVLRV
jgi:hypothetical protein